MLKRPLQISVLGLAIFLASLLTIACAPSAPEYTIVDKREVQGEKSIVTFGLNNSNGAAPLVQNYPQSKNFYRGVELNLVSNSRLDEIQVMDKIYAKYKVTKEDTKVCVIPLEVPAGQNFEYDLEWTEVLREGVIEEGAQGGGKQLGTYRILITMTCQVVGQRSMS